MQTTVVSEYFLLESMAKATDRLLNEGDRRLGINLALATFGKAFGANRVYIWENYEEPLGGKLLMSLGWEWMAEKIWQPTDNSQLQKRAFSTNTWWYKLISKGQVISARVKDLTCEEAEIFSTKKSHSVLLLPLIIDNCFWGILGFESDRSDREWSATERLILKTAASNIASAIARWQTETKLAVLEADAFEKAAISRISDRQWLCEEICNRETADKELCQNICYDRLTKVPNRSLFLEVLKKAIARSKNNPDYFFAVLFLDIDRFKIVNDSLGNLYGDELLVSIASRLNNLVRDKDVIARLGGDEFAIFLDNTSDLKNVKKVGERVKQELSLPFLLNQQKIFTSISIGIAISYKGYSQPEEILRDAEIVMLSAKHNSRSSYEIFDAATHKELVAQLKLEHDLRQAVIGLENQKSELTLEGVKGQTFPFQLYYQPIVTTDTGKIKGFEALLRWQHPTLGLVSPTDFIPIAEETGLIIPLGEWILREACQQLVTWQKQFPEFNDLSVSINLSARQFASPDLVENIDKIIQETNAEPSRINLEITESTIMKNPKLATETLWEFKKRKIQLSIDDFGTGYSCLSCLDKFPLDVLKIDRSFITELALEGKKSEIVRTVVNLAHNLGMDVTAEGVETSEQLKILQSWGCEFSQGYLFAKPLKSKNASEILQQKTFKEAA